MDGYNGYHPPSEIIAGLHNPDLKNRSKEYKLGDIMKARTEKWRNAQEEEAKVQGPSSTPSEAARREFFSIGEVACGPMGNA